MSGSWTLAIDVTEVNGVCEGEEIDRPYLETITIAQSGLATTVTGFSGAIGDWTGSFDGVTLRFGGTKNDGDPGETMTASYHLTYNPLTDAFVGSESWTWKGTSKTCRDGESLVGAQRDSPLEHRQIPNAPAPVSTDAVRHSGTKHSFRPRNDSVDFQELRDASRRNLPHLATGSERREADPGTITSRVLDGSRLAGEPEGVLRIGPVGADLGTIVPR